jgi:hypothetical protein
VSPEARRALYGVLEAFAAVLAMRLAIESWESLKWRALQLRADVERLYASAGAHLELERTVARERNGVLFEAWLATREGDEDGAD